MNRQALIALAAGILFGAGLAVSGMADPTRVRAFLDVAGKWDPTLAFVMVGAIIPMTIAWRIKAKIAKPLVAPRFDLPGTTRLDAKLLGGAVIFGIGWGVVGLCPGPAIADLAIHPRPALLFVSAMLAGMAAYRGCRLVTAYLAAPAAAAETNSQ
ncbi:MAG: YeeE/YedE family protein [Acidocella sp.]|nr:YeeE/YedE family protein [Acidocella sp.]